MSSIDERTVEMRFKNEQFEQGIKETTKSLASLKEGLKLPGAAEGLDEVQKTASRFSLRGVIDAVKNAAANFPILGAIGFAALSRLTNAAIDFGAKIAGAVLDPLIEGGKKRALSIEQAKFQFKGLGMDVEQSMEDALFAVKGTAFGLDEAATAAAQFGASGIKSGKEMQTALRGIAGVAAMAGTSYTEMADVFTKVAGQGRVMGDDLNRLGARGINAAATLGKALGKTEAEIRAMVSRGEISFEMFASAMSEAFGEHATKANETYAGSLANVRAALSRIGAAYYTPKFEMLRHVFNSLGPAIDRVADALGPLFDHFQKTMPAAGKAAAKLIDDLDFKWLEKAIVPIIKSVTNVFDALFNVLKPIGKAFLDIFPASSLNNLASMAKGVQKFTETLKMGEANASRLQRTFAGFFAVLDIGWTVLKLIVVSLAELFGVALDGSGSFLEVTARIGDFLVKVRDTIKSGNGLTRFFEGLTAVLGGAITGLKLAAGIIGAFISSVANADFGSFGAKVKNLTSRFDPLKKMGEFLMALWAAMPGVIKKVLSFIRPLTDAVGSAFKKLTDAIGKAIETADFSLILDALNTGLLAGLVLMIKSFLKGFELDLSLGLIDSIKEIFGGLTDTLSAMQTQLKAGTLMKIALAIGLLTASVVALSLIDSAALTKALTALTVMFVQLFASMAIFEKIAAGKGMLKMPLVAASMILLGIAINILASAVKKLADLDWNGLAKGLTGVVVLLGALAGVAKLMKGTGPGMIAAGIGLIALSAAVKILASAVTDLSGLSWEEMARGLVGVGGLLGALAIFTKLVSVNKAGILQSAGLILLAAAIKILASAVSDFAGMDWGELAKGLAALGGVLLAVALFTKLSGGSAMSIASAIGLVILAAAMKVLASAMADFGGMAWEEIAKSLVMLAGSLIIMAGAMYLMTGALPGAAALIIASAALMILAPALLSFQDLSWQEIAKIMVTLAGSLLIIAGGMALMTSALPGAAALLIVAAALRVMQPVLLSFADLSWVEIAKGLAMLAGVFLVLGIAGAALTPVIPTLIGLGVAITLLGIGVAAAGAGVFLFAAGLTALAAAGTAGAAALVVIVTTMASLLPMIATKIAEAIAAFAKSIAIAAPAVYEAMVVVITALLNAVIKLTPKVAETLVVLIETLIAVIVRLTPKINAALVKMINDLLNQLSRAVPRMVDSGMRMLQGILDGIKRRIGGIAQTGVEIIAKFIDGVGRGIPRVIQSGVNLILNFINGLATAIRNNSAAMGEAGANLASAIIEGMARGLTAGIGRIAERARSVARSALNAAKRVLGINSPSKEFFKLGEWSGEGMSNGLDYTSRLVGRSAEGMGMSAISTLKKTMSGIGDIIDADIDLNPVVTPVLDLSGMQKEAAKMSKMLPNPNMSVDYTFTKAKDVESSYQANVNAMQEQAVATKIQNIEMKQYNTSPKALSAAEIYRQTKNQLSTMRGAQS